LTAFRYLVDVGAAVFLSFLDQAFFDECVEVGVESSVMDFFFVVVFEFVSII
jgi:hypothetical protein